MYNFMCSPSYSTWKCLAKTMLGNSGESFATTVEVYISLRMVGIWKSTISPFRFVYSMQ